MNNIVITSDCVSDLNDELRKKYDIATIPYYVATDSGRFKDMDEISSRNVIEYFSGGGQKISTIQPSDEEYKAFFTRFSENGQEVIHFCLGSGVSPAYGIATEVAKKFQGKVHVFDTENLSSGMGLLVLRAVEMAAQGSDVQEILDELNRIKYKVSTTFIARSAEYLYRSSRVGKFAHFFCQTFNVHPVLQMKKGRICLHSLRVGKFEKAVLRYVRRQLRCARRISKKRAFITHANCKMKLIGEVKKAAIKKCNFENLYITEASATITSNCGVDTLGILFLRKK